MIYSQFAPLPIRPSNKLAPLAKQLAVLAQGKYGASWYPVLPARLLTFYWTLSLRCFDLVSIGRVGCTHYNSPHGRNEWLPSSWCILGLHRVTLNMTGQTRPMSINTAPSTVAVYRSIFTPPHDNSVNVQDLQSICDLPHCQFAPVTNSPYVNMGRVGSHCYQPDFWRL